MEALPSVLRSATPRRRLRILAPLILCGLFSCAGEGGTSEGGSLSALLVTIDTTRADALACYGGVEGATPHLDQLAAEGILYERAYTVTPVTAPSHASMLTGLYPLRHSVRSNDMLVLPRDVDTIAEMVRAEGVQTGALIASVALTSRLGMNQGFDHYGEPATRGQDGRPSLSQRLATEVVTDAIRWIEARDRSRPFFLWVHLFDPHSPYSPPPSFRGGVYGEDPYLGEVGYLDQQVGRLLANLRSDGALDEALVIVVADHGEARGDHGEDTHGILCYDSTMRVPMIVRYPDAYRAGERSQEIVSVTDVHPTLVEAFGLSLPDDLDGHSLYRKTVPADRGVYFESYEGYLSFGYSPIAGWLDGRGKYIHSSKPQFYDIAADPTESQDLLRERGSVATEHREKIAALAGKDAFKPIPGQEIDEEMLGSLRKLGYAGLGDASMDVPHPLATIDRPDASTLLTAHRTLAKGMDLYHAGRFAEAEAALQLIVETLPWSPAALMFLGFSRMNLGKHAEAVTPLRALIAERPEMAQAHFNLGKCLKEIGQPAEATTAFEEAVRLDATNREYYAFLIRLLIESGRQNEAMKYDRRARSLGVAK